MCPYLVAGNVSLRSIGFAMLFVHGVTALCAFRLPETKGVELGRVVNVQNGSKIAGVAKEREKVSEYNLI